MSKKVLCLLIMCLLTGCTHEENLSSKLNLGTDIYLETTFTRDCKNSMDIYYQNNEQRIYLNCIDDIDILKADKKISLKDYLDKDTTDVNEFTEKLYSSLNLKRTEEENEIYEDSNLILISCNKDSESAKDIVIGKTSVEYDMNKMCISHQRTIEITATIKEIYDDEILVEKLNSPRDKYIITRTTAFEKSLLENLKVGTTITFTYSGTADLTDPPKIRVSSLKIAE